MTSSLAISVTRRGVARRYDHRAAACIRASTGFRPNLASQRDHAHDPCQAGRAHCGGRLGLRRPPGGLWGAVQACVDFLA